MKTLGVIPRCFTSAKPAALTGPGERGGQPCCPALRLPADLPWATALSPVSVQRGQAAHLGGCGKCLFLTVSGHLPSAEHLEPARAPSSPAAAPASDRPAGVPRSAVTQGDPSPPRVVSNRGQAAVLQLPL